MPNYPHALRETGVEGMVHAQFVIDTTGRANLGSLRFLRSTHELFEIAARDNLRRARWNVPRRQGVGVRAQVEEIIEFRGGESLLGRFHETLIRHNVDSSGVLHTWIAAHVPYDSLEAPRLTEQEQWAIYAAVTEYFIRREVSKPSAFCIGANGGEPPPGVIERWRFTDSALVPLSRCPPTYARMIRGPRDPVAPRGYQDPVSLVMRPLKPWARDLVVVEVRWSSSMARSENMCQVSRRPDGWTGVRCHETSAWIH